MVRDYLSKHPAEWEQIIGSEEFKSYFAVKGTALKNVPAGYDEDHLQAKYLKNKSWYLEYFIKDEELLDGEQFLDRAVDVFRKMKPFNDYLNKALEGFEMPQR